MHTFYYEISDASLKFTGGVKYFAEDHEFFDLTYGQVINNSERIWKMDHKTGVVSWQKNRHKGIMAKIDEKEFLMVQLKAERNLSIEP